MSDYISPSILQIRDKTYLDFDFQVDIQDASKPDCSGGWSPDPEYLNGAFGDYELCGDPIYTDAEIRDKIREIDAQNGWCYNRIVYPHNQGREGTCVYNMVALMKQIVWDIQFGDHRAVQFSPISGYRWNAPNSRSGSMVGQSAIWLAGTGLLPTNRSEVRAILEPHGVQHFHPNTGYSTAFESGWKTTAKLFRIDEWMKVRTVNGWYSANLNGHPSGGGRDGHAVAHCLLALNGSNVLSGYCNSWGAWGSTLQTPRGPLKSFGWDSRAKVQTMVSRDAWVLRTTFVPLFMAV